MTDRRLQCNAGNWGEPWCTEDQHDDSVAHTIGRLIDDVRELFREEVALARAELRHEVSAFAAVAAQIGAGAAAGAFAAGFLLLGARTGIRGARRLAGVGRLSGDGGGARSRRRRGADERAEESTQHPRGAANRRVDQGDEGMDERPDVIREQIDETARRSIAISIG